MFHSSVNTMTELCVARQRNLGLVSGRRGNFDLYYQARKATRANSLFRPKCMVGSFPEGESSRGENDLSSQSAVEA
jgi:hypothetical protein